MKKIHQNITINQEQNTIVDKNFLQNLKEKIFLNLKHEKKPTIFIVYICLRVIFMQI